MRYIVCAVFLSAIIALNFNVQAGSALAYVAPMTWSPDGTRVAVINNDIEVREADTGRILLTLSDDANIPMLAWSPDSSIIAVPSSHQTVKLWSAADGQLLNTLSGQNDFITTVTWTIDGTRLVSIGADSRPSLFLWDAKTGNLISTHNGGTVVAAAFSPDGKKFVVSNSLSISILDGVTFEVLATSPRVPCCTNQMYSLKWSSDGAMLVTGSINGLVTLWDANTAQALQQFQANSHYALQSQDVDNLALSWVRAITFGAEDSTILAVSGDGTIGEWDITSGALIQEKQIEPVLTAAWSPYGGRLAVLETTIQDILSLNDAPVFDISSLKRTFKVIVPMPTQKQLRTIADACNIPTTVRQTLDAQMDTLSNFVSQVAALPEDTIPPACSTDLLAVANALQGQ